MSNLWNELISKLPSPHFLQTYEWGQVKAKYGWIPYYAVWTEDGKWKVESNIESLSTFHSPIVASALILKRQILSRGLVARLCILYSPKGPLLDWSNEFLRTRVLNDLQSFAKKQGAIFLKIDPDVVLGRGVPESNADLSPRHAVLGELDRRGWKFSSEQIQFKNTVLINLSATEEEMIMRMKSKTRYNIRLAEKKGVTVRVGTLEDLPALYKMYAETSVRDGFVIRDENYYMTVWKTFAPNPQSLITNYQLPSAIPLIAEVDGEPVAAIFLFMFAGRAYYVYGMSRNAHREKMPTYLLQWDAIKRAKANGCAAYDLWGAPDVFDESDSMWGVYRFKEGLSGEVIRTLGAYDFAPNKLWYKLYTDIMPRVLDVMRSRGKEKTKQGIEGN